MNQTEKKNQRVDEIKTLITPFAIEYMDEETYGFCLKLLNKLGRKRVLDITRGKKEIWAASVVYVIARINFMFDKAQDYWMTADEIADFFGVSKSTVSQKATLIEKACGMGMVDEELTRETLLSGFRYVQLANGLIVPAKSTVDVTYAASPSIPEEVEAQAVFEDVDQGPSRGEARREKQRNERIARLQERTRISQEKQEKREKLAAEEAEKERLADLERQPRLF